MYRLHIKLHNTCQIVTNTARKQISRMYLIFWCSLRLEYGRTIAVFCDLEIIPVAVDKWS
jgi:hypothetical protein